MPLSRPSRRARLAPLAVLSVSAVALGIAGLTVAPASAAANDVAEGEGQVLTGGGSLNINDIAGLDPAYSATPSGQPTYSSTVDLSALGDDGAIDLGSGVQLPDGTTLGSLVDGGVLGQYAATDTSGASYGASGALTSAGAIDTSAGGNPADDATVHLTPLLGNVSGVSSLISSLDLDLGAVSASATGTAASPASYAGDYQLTGAKLDVDSPAISQLDQTLVADLGTGNSGLTADLNSLLGSSSALSTLTGSISGVSTTLSNDLLGVVGVDLTPTVTVNSTDLSAAIPQTVESDGADGTPQGTVSIDLSKGSISVDLGKLLSTETGKSDGTLNGLPANYALLQGATVQSALAGAINDALNAAVTSIQQSLTTELDNVDVTVALNGTVTLATAPIATIDMTATGTLADLVDSNYSAFTVTDDSTALGVVPLGEITGPIESALVSDLLPAVGGLVQGEVTDLTGNIATLGTDLGATLGDPTTGLLADVNEVVDPVVNVQPTNADPAQAATFATPGAGIATPGDAGFTERAIQLNLLPDATTGAPVATLALASASVESTDQAASLAPSSSTPAPGDTVTFSGSGFSANEAVTITYTDSSGTVIGSTDVTAGADGTFTGASITVPSTDADGDTIAATATGGTSGRTADTTLAVTASTSGTATSGTATSGTATAGTSTSGTATSGTATSGTATAGTATSGTATSGTATSGTATSGTATAGTATSGTSTSGTSTSGTATSGTSTSGTATAGTATSGSAPAGTITPGTVTITGTPQVGNTLVGNAGTWKPSGTTLAYKWTLPDGTVIGTGQTLVVPSSAAGKKITLTVTGSKTGYTTATGQASVSVTSPGTPKVTRVSGADRYATAVAISKSTFPVAGSAKVVFVATGQNFPDALSAGPAAAKLDGPLLLTQTNTLTSGTASEIKRLKPAKVIVVGEHDAVSNGVLAALKKIVPNTVRWGGADRYGTSLIIAKNAFGTASSAFVATGVTFPDALSASAYAGSQKFPVVLVNGTSTALPSGLTSYLKGAKVSSLKIAGGTSAVSSTIFSELEKGTGKSATRYAGADRYATSVAINKEFSTGPLAYLATGANFPDALAGAAAAATNHAPLYVVHPTCVPTSALSQLKAWHTGTVRVLGGPAALDSAVAELKGC